MNLKEFGLFFAEKREKSGFSSQRQLSIASGISNGTIARIEAGTQKVSPDTLKILAPFLKGVTYAELMDKAGYLTLGPDETVYHIDEIGDPKSANRNEFIEKFLKDFEKLSPNMQKSIHEIVKSINPSDS